MESEFKADWKARKMTIDSTFKSLARTARRGTGAERGVTVLHFNDRCVWNRW